MAPTVRLRHRGWYGVVFLLAIIIWLNTGIGHRAITYSIPIKRDPHVHPIAQLTARAKARWEAKLGGQSKTLGEAVREYQRRYGRKPPRGFDKWYEWAVEHKLKLVDEFDSVHENLLPFWGLSPAQIESRRKEMIKLGISDRLFSLQVRNGAISDDPEGLASTTRWPINKHYYALLDGIAQFLPDTDLTINLYDIPLVYIALEERERLIALGKAKKFATDEEHEVFAESFNRRESDMSWRDLRRICPESSPIWQTTSDAFGEEVLSSSWQPAELAFRLPADMGGFIYDHETAMDMCANPEIRWQHGNFLTTRTLNLGFRRNYLYPVFSWTRYPQSSDILIPTSYRFEFNRPKPLPWSDLKPKIAWRGTLTGMDALDTADTFASQRYRLGEMMASEFDPVPVLTNPTNKTTYAMTELRSGPLNEQWMDVGVAGKPDQIGGTRAADIARAKFAFTPWMSNQERNSHKILLDVDGWGWSARFRDLLWAGGAVLKATVFQEATTDWLEPWYHYIPLDYAYRDLYSIALYYLGLEGTDQVAHDDELREIGEHSREWVDEHAQWDQHLAYMYRLCLEWARINGDRSSDWDFDG